MAEAMSMEDRPWNIAIYGMKKEQRNPDEIFNWGIGREREVYKKIEKDYQRGSRKIALVVWGSAWENFKKAEE